MRTSRLGLPNLESISSIIFAICLAAKGNRLRYTTAVPDPERWAWPPFLNGCPVAGLQLAESASVSIGIGLRGFYGASLWRTVVYLMPPGGAARSSNEILHLHTGLLHIQQHPALSAHAISAHVTQRLRLCAALSTSNLLLWGAADKAADIRYEAREHKQGEGVIVALGGPNHALRHCVS